MTETILVIDNADEILGEFFTECLDDIEQHENDAKNLKIIRSNALNDLSISLTLDNLSKFIFLAYSHGNDSSLLANGITPYISSELNINKFPETFFYACACYTGKSLSHALIANGCSAYIGYDGEFTIWDFNRKPFIECANYGYKLYLQGMDVESIIAEMKLKYDEHIDNYNNDIMGAAMLLSNKTALVAHGNLKYSLNQM